MGAGNRAAVSPERISLSCWADHEEYHWALLRVVSFEDYEVDNRVLALGSKNDFIHWVRLLVQGKRWYHNEGFTADLHAICYRLTMSPLTICSHRDRFRILGAGGKSSYTPIFWLKYACIIRSSVYPVPRSKPFPPALFQLRAYFTPIQRSILPKTTMDCSG